MYETVKEYYGKHLQGSADLKTKACCDSNAVPDAVKGMLARIHPQVSARYYGCGLVCPPLLQNCRILDLGCGAGRDVYLLSQMAGSRGEVIGVDMTDVQLHIARTYQEWHSEQFGFDNVRFLQGYIEQLDALELEPGSFDVIVSNCVLNLSPDKEAVLKSVYRLLKPGGEFYFSDIYADRRLAETLRADPVLYGECLGGALYWNDFLCLARQAGFRDPRLVEDRQLDIKDAEVSRQLGKLRFFSATYRLFKLDGLEPACEDYGQSLVYRGSLPQHPDGFVLDKHHRFETGSELAVCGNTWRMLSESRFRPHFEFRGNFRDHAGLFEGCGSSLPFDSGGQARASTACC